MSIKDEIKKIKEEIEKIDTRLDELEELEYSKYSEYKEEYLELEDKGMELFRKLIGLLQKPFAEDF